MTNPKTPRIDVTRCYVLPVSCGVSFGYPAMYPYTDSMRRVRPATLAIAALFALAACGAGGPAICTSAGGTYQAGTCTRSSAGQQGAEQQCQARGGVYLRGQDLCAVGAGGA